MAGCEYNLIMLYFGIILLYGGVFASHSKNVPMVSTSLGPISGYYKYSFENRVFSAFEDIPYAVPPVGDLRFEPPRPCPAWTGALNASHLYTCEQVRSEFMPLSGIKVQEDCLYLNVYVPKRQPPVNDNYDVIVNIHGGAFMMGDSALAGPGYIMDRDVVYVNLNYRLGALGFLSTEDAIVPGNNGLKDQQLALKWVQAHG
ncbi:esterase SG1-like isoform X1 [Photinus pyralis]|uniref:esterase SG1-like isoform X1 n=1 Tax=Photinus pyralis TaxID=7054 RepID=UPI00126703AE|nr:esterase SG1-like isoform X1 [Photinus pyralis]